jgi:hypothetical protein
MRERERGREREKAIAKAKAINGKTSFFTFFLSRLKQSRVARGAGD